MSVLLLYRRIKASGHAGGTLTGYEQIFHRPWHATAEATFVVYYDLEAKGWRTFHAEYPPCRMRTEERKEWKGLLTQFAPRGDRRPPEEPEFLVSTAPNASNCCRTMTRRALRRSPAAQRLQTTLHFHTVCRFCVHETLFLKTQENAAPHPAEEDYFNKA